MIVMRIMTEEEIIYRLEKLGTNITPMMEWEIGQYLVKDDLPAATYLIEVWEALCADDLC